jgi:UDP-glucose 4-epimerase
VAASEKIRRELGWKATKPELEVMIGDAWEWAQAHPEGYAGQPAG